MTRCPAASPPASTRLLRSRRIAIYTTGVGVCLTGMLWLIVHYLVTPQHSFGLSANSSETWLLTLHGGFAFAAIWLFGSLWGIHIPAGWSRARRRFSGGTLAGLLGWLIISGYLLYYAGDEALRAAVSLGHWMVGLIIPIGFLLHRSKRVRKSHSIERAEKIRSRCAVAIRKEERGVALQGDD